jgi:hypothetical protein
LRSTISCAIRARLRRISSAVMTTLSGIKKPLTNLCRQEVQFNYSSYPLPASQDQLKGTDNYLIIDIIAGIKG